MNKARSVAENAELVVLQPPPDPVRVEKNLNSLGFFATTYKRNGMKPVRNIECGTREIEGKRTVQKARIAGDADLGLPAGADRDKYYAFMKIVEDRRKLTGQVENPVRFTSYELLLYLGLKPCGKLYKDVDEWLTRMVSTTITSEWAVYLRGSKKFVRDTFHVFDRSVRVGQELSDGQIADCNFVWLSAWQLENINSNFLLPLDLQEYLSLRNDLAKGLLFHLNVWFYASRGTAVEKRYDRLCELLGIKMRTAVSLIRQAFEPSMNELIALGYLESWDVAKIEGFKTEYKIVLNPGRRNSSSHYQLTGVVDSRHDRIVKMLVDRGIREKTVRQLLLDVPTDQPVVDQIEYFDHVRSQMAEKLRNPPGLLLSMIRNNDPVPVDFLTTTKADIARRRQAPSRAEREQADREFKELQLKAEYSDYCDELVRSFKESNQSETEALRAQILQQLRKCRDIKTQGEWALHRAVESALQREILKTLDAVSLDQFKATQQRPLFS
jgi:hypothetical protein